LSVPNDSDAMDDSVKSSLKLGLFSYPVLQAADILIHRATHVPVGEDQRQHLEFARKCATNFNHVYGKVLVYPETVLAPIRRIKSLRAPTQKMSKSDDNAAARILITDDPATIWKKIMAAVTDSIPSVTYDPESRPGVSNLLEILAVFDCQSRPPDVLAAELSGASLKDLKATVANSIVDGLRGVSERYLEILSGNRSYLHRVQEEGAIQARANAAETMAAVRSAIGL
jgi:tryptophanyl-tRNA synthetase